MLAKALYFEGVDFLKLIINFFKKNHSKNTIKVRNKLDSG